MSETKRFPLRTILTATTGRLLTRPRNGRDNGIGDLYKFLDHVCGESPYTHQLGRFGDEAKSWLLRWFPELGRVESMLPHLDAITEQLKGEGWYALNGGVEGWLRAVMRECGCKARYDVPRIPADDHDRKDPYDELVAMRGTDEGIEIVEIPTCWPGPGKRPGRHKRRASKP